MKSHNGEGHGNTANFEFSVLGPGIPDGKGGYLPGRFEPTNIGEIKRALETFFTPDGREHSAGKTKATDVPMTFLANDMVALAMLDAWKMASDGSIKGYKPPCQVVDWTTDDQVAITWEVQEVFLKEYNGGAMDREKPEAATVSVVFSFFNPTRMPQK
jgi:hypothetical protein